MKKKKILDYEWELGQEKLMLQVGCYAQDNRLYIDMVKEGEYGLESFGELTVNLPYENVLPGEAFIPDFAAKSKLAFIKKHRLGKVLPETASSGYAVYTKVAFDLKRLAEFDPKGVKEFCLLHGIEEGQKEKTEKPDQKQSGPGKQHTRKKEADKKGKER